jgi:hypothetical protein
LPKARARVIAPVSHRCSAAPPAVHIRPWRPAPWQPCYGRTQPVRRQQRLEHVHVGSGDRRRIGGNASLGVAVQRQGRGSMDWPAGEHMNADTPNTGTDWAETDAEQAEATRQKAEERRELAAGQQANAEVDRRAAEEQRELAHEMRRTAEDLRLVAETARRTVEEVGREILAARGEIKPAYRRGSGHPEGEPLGSGAATSRGRDGVAGSSTAARDCRGDAENSAEPLSHFARRRP